jgi:serine/threonine-protein kinase
LLLRELCTWNGDVYAMTVGRVYRLAGGTPPAEPYAGTGVVGDGGDGGDGGPALGAQINAPHGLAVAPDGALLISDTGNGRLRRVDPSTQTITSIATIAAAYGVAVGPDGLVYLSSVTSDRVVRLEASGSVTPFVTGIESPSSMTSTPRECSYVTEANTPLARIWRVGRDGTAAPLRGRASG